MIYQNIKSVFLKFVRGSMTLILSIWIVVISYASPIQIFPTKKIYHFEVMCTNVRWIYNKYVDKRILVSCGYCKACLQEKANKRAIRLKNEYNSDTVVLFVGLTYDRYSVPYILHSDVLNHESSLSIYRDCTIRRDPVTHEFKRVLGRVEIGSNEVVDYNYSLKYLPYLKKSNFKFDKGKIGVCVFKDVQDFKKRLKQNLNRKYNFNGKYKIFNTFEYGENTYRPHIHLLIYAPAHLYQVFKSAIVESWPFADRDRTLKGIEPARDAASYVASYVNCDSKFPRFLKKNFPPKYSFSQGLGCGSDSFQLDKILECVGRQNMSYNLPTVRDGVPTYVNIPIPKYVINRYFPLFKGYSRLTSCEVQDLLRSVASISSIYDKIYKIDNTRRRLDYHFEFPFVKSERMIYWTFEDMFMIGTRLHNAYTRYKRITGKSTIDFAIDFTSVWSTYKNTIYKRFALDDEPLEFKFDNKLDNLVTPRRLLHSARYSDLYDKKIKTRSVNNTCYSQYYYDV